jgi:O-antigen/teichoic acid export membrane protein
VTVDDSTKARPLSDGQRGSFSGAVARLTRVNALIVLAGLITGPIVARALGVDGRGDLAAITAVLTVGPWVLDLGLSSWLARERARGVGREELLGAALPVAFACSLIGVVAAIPLSQALGQGRPVVTAFLQVGLFLMPVSVGLHTVAGLATGESRWGLVVATRVVGTVLPALGIVALAVLGRLTLISAAAAYLVGGFLGGLLFLQVVRGTRRLVFDRRRTAAASSFGVKSWLSTVAATANNRLDQVLMAGLVPSRELGLYAIAVTTASLALSLVGAVSDVLFPRVAEGDRAIAARSTRITMSLVATAGVMLAVLSPWLIPFVFGEAFTSAVPMVVILLMASVPMAGAFVLSFALIAANNPQAAMYAEFVAFAFTIPALILLLPDYGGLLAAVVSLLAYTIRFGMQLWFASRMFSMKYRAFLIPTRADLTWLKDRLLRTLSDRTGR